MAINYPIFILFLNTKANIEDTTKNCKKKGVQKEKDQKKEKKERKMEYANMVPIINPFYF
jgi:hypothetical protein